MMSGRKIFYIACVLLVCSRYAHADIVYLKNGSRVEGVILSETENNVTINIGHGATVEQDKDFIEKIERVARKQGIDAVTADNSKKELRIIELLKLIRGAENEKKLMIYFSKMDPDHFMRIASKTAILAGVILHLVFLFFLTLILLIMCRINKELPFGIKMARALLFFTIVVMGAFLSVFTFFFIPTMIRLAASSIFMPFLIILMVQILFLRIFYWVFVNLAKFDPTARKVQILFSILGLLNFPVNTVLNGVILYSLFKKENKNMFLQSG